MVTYSRIFFKDIMIKLSFAAAPEIKTTAIIFSRSLVVILLAMLLLSAGCIKPEKAPPTARNGVLDLTGWNFEERGIASLDGEWEFYPGTFIAPEEFAAGEAPPPSFIRVPDIWRGLSVNGTRLTGKGHATYRLSVGFSESPGLMGLKTLAIGSANRLFAGGKLIGFQGKVAANREDERPEIAPAVYTFPVEGKSLDLVFHVSNHNDRSGGLWYSLKFGRFDQVFRYRENKVAYELFLIGVLFIIGLYHIGLFLVRRKEIAFLLFGIFCLIMAVRTSVMDEKYLFRLMGGIPFGMAVKLEYLTFYLGLPVFAMYFKSVFSEDFSKMALRIIQGIGLAFSLVVIATPPRIFTETINVFQGLTIIISLYIVFVSIKTLVNRRKSAWIFFAGLMVLFVAVVNDILYVNNIVFTATFLPPAIFIFILLQALILAVRFSNAFSAVEGMAVMLDNTIKELLTEIEERKKAEHEREMMQKQLEDSLAKVIQGFIPICASCKKIRNDDGSWIQVERFVSDRSEAKFSHSLCPVCADTIYPGINNEKE